MRYPFRAVLGTVLLPLIIFLSTLFGATPVEAGTANLTWVAPTTRTDGATCTGPELFRYRGVGYRRVASKDVDVWYARATARVAAACRTA